MENNAQNCRSRLYDSLSGAISTALYDCNVTTEKEALRLVLGYSAYKKYSFL
jgi:hypothetical protein